MRKAERKSSADHLSSPEPRSYLLQSVVELHGPEQEALLAPQS